MCKRRAESLKKQRRDGTIAVAAAAVIFAAPAFEQQSSPISETLFTNVHLWRERKAVMNASVLIEGNLIKHVS